MPPFATLGTHHSRRSTTHMNMPTSWLIVQFLKVEARKGLRRQRIMGVTELGLPKTVSTGLLTTTPPVARSGERVGLPSSFLY